MRPSTLWAIALGSVGLVAAGGVLGLDAARAGEAVEGFTAGYAACATPVVKAASDGCLRPCWCPDDYRAKPSPCFCVPRVCGCCDDYCAKPIPCVCPPVGCGCCDDYCPKPAPCVRWPCAWPAFFKCPPPLPCGQ
jgi:hypothetical protein